MKLSWGLGVVAAASLFAASAGAAVITGPAVTLPGSWDYSGLEFTALQDSTLTGFVYHNQGAADSVLLTDSAGDILETATIASGTPNDAVSVSWALTAGQSYWLIQTASGNGEFAYYGSSLPANADIAIQFAGSFGHSVSDVISGTSDASYAIGPNRFWANFNDISTDAAITGVPEPGVWALLTLGFGMIGSAARRRDRGRVLVR